MRFLDIHFGDRLHLARADLMKRSLQVRWAAWVCLFAAPCLALAQNGGAWAKAAPGVDWQGLVVRASGSGAPDVNALSPTQARLGAEKAARADALRNLLTEVKGIPITAGRTVGAAMANEEVRTKVEGAARGFKIAAKRYYSDMGVEMDVELPIAALMDVLAPGAPQAPASSKGKKKNTGLVVDARGLKVTASLAPRLIDDSGKEIYGLEWLSEEARKSSGVAAYVPDLGQAKKSLRVGNQPLVVRATDARGSDIVLTAEDARKLGETNNGYLAEGRVVIVFE